MSRPLGRPSDRARLLAAPCAPDSLAAWIRRFLEALTVQHRSALDLRVRRSRLAHFHAWCLDQGITQPQAVTHATMARFQRYLFGYRKPDGQPMSISGQVGTLLCVQSLFRWLVRHRHVHANPAADLDLPTVQGHYALREPLNAEEVAAVLRLPDLGTPWGLRDRAVLELFYATGIRRSELAALILSDIEPSRGTLHVRQGKGRKDRFVPVGERALAWVDKYRHDARPLLLADPAEQHLFLNAAGGPLSAYALSWRIRDYFNRAGITKRGACHLFRHTMATAMLDNGADLRYVQEMLGHSMIGTTQRYTHVSIARLKAVHAATHPGATLQRRDDPDALPGEA
jgi:integrase/recombinase XerD